jgi:hypothetical protein
VTANKLGQADWKLQNEPNLTIDKSPAVFDITNPIRANDVKSGRPPHDKTRTFSDCGAAKRSSYGPSLEFL